MWKRKRQIRSVFAAGMTVLTLSLGILSITVFAGAKISVNDESEMRTASGEEPETSIKDWRETMMYQEDVKASEAYERAEDKAEEIYDNIYAQIKKGAEEEISVQDITRKFFITVYDFYRLIKINLWVLMTMLWLFSTVIFMILKRNKSARKSVVKGAVILTILLLGFTFGGGMFFG